MLDQHLRPYFRMSDEVALALSEKAPVVALESTVITHGLPYPQNLQLARDMEADVSSHGAVPATIAILEGLVRIGLDAAQLEKLAQGGDVHKISVRDFAPAIIKGWSGGTTVAGTMLAAHQVGIKVFATGGIGGVHHQPAIDISADLPQLAQTPMVVVCAGAKAILDIPATLEYLETHSIPVVGFGTDEFPGFYYASTGLPVSVRVDTAAEVVRLARAQWELGVNKAVLVAQPPPREHAIPKEEIIGAIEQALIEVEERQIRGQAVSPYLLRRVSELTAGASLRANLALLRNNAQLAANIARELSHEA